jgi:energy-coupling factor transporter ATP-binding protein EcfA2
MDLNAIIPAEIAAINRTFAEHLGPNKAGTCAKWTVVAGTSYITYGVGRGPGVGVDAVTKLAPELSEALSALRRKRTPVRFRDMPLSIEVNYPKTEPLDWRKARTLVRYDTMLTGRNYSDGEPHDDVLSFDDTPHTLVVGTTGSGKTTLLRMMIATLALNTDPDMLRLYLVDPKGEDFLPFEQLPHKEMFVGKDDAPRAIARVREVLETRQNIRARFHGERVVLVIDELSQIDNPVAIKQLNTIMGAGRSKKVNVILATQYPTKEVIGKVDLSNLTTRFVGQITTSKEAYIAAGRGETGAHLLPGKGAFLRIDGGNMTRLQAYWLDDNGTAELVKAARQRWGERDGVVSDREVQVVTRVVLPEVAVPVTEPVITGSNQGIAVDWPVPGQKTAPAVTGAPVTFPLPRTRPPSQAEVLALRQLYAETRSKNEVLRVAYGAKNGLLLGYVNQALSEGGAA